MKENVLIVGLNWLGDSIMSLPAIAAFKAEHPETKVSLAVKPKLREFWQLVSQVDDIVAIHQGAGGTLKTAREIMLKSFDRAYVFPNSFRSGLLPFMAGIPRRIGMAGHTRSAMLSEITSPQSEASGKRHQAWEYIDILGLKAPEDFPSVPKIAIPSDVESRVEGFMPEPRKNTVALIPGAAFGDSKRWPAEYFCEVGSRVVRDYDAAVLVLGAPGEKAVCSQIAERIGEGAKSSAGETSIVEMIALLKKCQFAVSNDCGGMHVAAAAGVRIVGVFGLTDPLKTGPVGTGHKIVTPEGVTGTRDISKNSSEARGLLASISPDRVYSELCGLMATSTGDV